MSLDAYLCGNVRQPEIRLIFGRGAVHAATGLDLMEWVKKAPSRHWDSEARMWVIKAFGTGKHPDALLRKAGFTVHYEPPPGFPADESLSDVLSLADLVPPLVRASQVKPTMALVRPRFTGWEGTRDLLGPGAKWDKENGRFEVPLTDLLAFGEPKAGLEIEPATIEAARALLTKGETFNNAYYDDATIAAALTNAASSSGLDLTGDDEAAHARLAHVVGDIPDWFGMTPYPYQRLGAMAVAAGRSLLCDPTGLGKTVQIIGAFALRNVQRGVIVVPPIVVTNWAREIEKCGLAATPPKPPTKAEIKRAEKAQRAAFVDIEKAAIAQAVATGASPRAAKAAAKVVIDAILAGAATAGSGANTALNDTTGAAASAAAVGAPVGVSLAGAGNPLAPPSLAAPFGANETSVTDNHSVDIPDREVNRASIPGEQNPYRHLVVFRAGRKEPDLPDRGIIIVPDSLLSSRPALVARIAEWGPDCFAYDEAHRARTWTSKRAAAAMGVVSRMKPGSLRIAATATPLFSNPSELASLLAITGHLDWVFGGYEAYMRKFCKRNFFQAWVPRVENLPELRAILTDRVWVRRVKTDVLRDLPEKTRHGLVLDVDLKGFRTAHDEVIAKITTWLDQWIAQESRYPNPDEIEAWSRQQIGLISPLRKAAGVAKVPHTLDMINDWITDEVALNADGTFTCDRPLIVWAHHHEVIDALKVEAPAHLKDAALPMVRVLDGSCSAAQRGQIADAFQAGQIPVLIASITAAGVGVTLTRGSDAWFCETDWSVPNVVQAEDRQWRIGQKNHVTVTTLLAEGTLDAHIQSVLGRKASIIEQIVGASSDTEMELSDAELNETAAPFEIVEGLINVAIEQHKQTTGVAA